MKFVLTDKPAWTIFILALILGGCTTSDISLNTTGLPPEVQKTAAEARGGDPKAQSELGEMYLSGKGVPQDFKEAANWYMKAARKGYAQAQFSLGNLYFNGEGVPKDYVEAYAWFNLAAAQGYKGAKLSRYIVKVGMTREQLEQAQSLSKQYFSNYAKQP